MTIKLDMQVRAPMDGRIFKLNILIGKLKGIGYLVVVPSNFEESYLKNQDGLSLVSSAVNNNYTSWRVQYLLRVS